MDSNPIIGQIILQVILIALNAVFACAEIAVISMNDNKLAKLAQQGDKRAIRLAALTSQPARFLATIQVAITLSGFLGSAFAADNFSDKLVEVLLRLGVKIPEATLESISVVLITLILAFFTLVLGELVPKRIAMKKAEALALGMSGLVTFISKLFAPLVWLLTASTNILLRLVGINPDEEDEEVTEEEIRMMVDAGSEKGTIDSEEKELIQNIFEFDDLSIEEICTHRRDTDLLWLEESPADWEETIHATRHSIYPVCGKSVDHIVGILNAKDYFRLKDKSKENILKEAVTQPYFVPEHIKADVLFRNMKNNGHYFAVVLDEYGGMTGIITMNDLVSQLVGEFDNDGDGSREPDIMKVEEGIWHIRGSASLDEVEEQLKVPLPTEEYDTFGGYVFGILGTVPADGSTFEIESGHLHIKVEEVKEHHVEKTRVKLSGKEEQA